MMFTAIGDPITITRMVISKDDFDFSAYKGTLILLSGYSVDITYLSIHFNLSSEQEKWFPRIFSRALALSKTIFFSEVTTPNDYSNDYFNARRLHCNPIKLA